jgi:tRNA(fMet)-specific endonuclease VapC
MERLILDTSVLLTVEHVASSLDALIDDEDDITIAAITAAELLVGVELASDAHKERRRTFVADILSTIPIERHDLDVACAHATLLAHVRRAGRPRGAHDLLIAATALTHGRTVLFTELSGFADLPGVAVGHAACASGLPVGNG